MNIDNGWYAHRGLETLPDAKGLWPLREKGFGGGNMFWAYDQRIRPHFNYHLLAMTALLGFGGYITIRTVKRELEIARMRADFVSTVSHEFRSPLAGILQLGECCWTRG